MKTTFRGFQGQIESGELAVGDQITVLPSGTQAGVKTILVGDRESQSAAAGQPVTVQLDREIDISRGCVLVKGPPGMECIRVKVIRMIINMAMIMVPMRFRINLTITFSFFRVHGRRTGNGAPTAALWP